MATSLKQKTKINPIRNKNNDPSFTNKKNIKHNIIVLSKHENIELLNIKTRNQPKTIKLKKNISSSSVEPFNKKLNKEKWNINIRKYSMQHSNSSNWYQ